MTIAEQPYDNPFGSGVEQRALYEYHIARNCTLPLLAAWGVEVREAQILDLGCGSGGLTVALAEAGALCTGVDLQEKRIAQAVRMAADHQIDARFVAGDILEMEDVGSRFDLVILSEVVEHLGNLASVETLLSWCSEHMAEPGFLYVSFPPWYGPFAGHQAGWPTIRYIPWYHLMPGSLKRFLAMGHAAEYEEFAQELGHLTVGDFESTLHSAGLEIVHGDLYLIRPEFRFRYGLPELRSKMLARGPFLREVATTGAYYLLTRGAA